MTQLAPTKIAYNQLMTKLSSIQDKYIKGDLKTSKDVLNELNGVIQELSAHMGMPMSEINQLVMGEPVRSKKINDFWEMIGKDIQSAQEDLDVIRAAVIFTHNLTKTELLKAEGQNKRVDNKLKTLQLYSNSRDSNVNLFGDYFKGTDFTDIPLSSTVDLTTEGRVTLMPLDKIDLINTAEIKILETSNGIPGNNQEIAPGDAASVDPITNEKNYIFYGQTNPANDLKRIKDKNPTTWMEYESLFVYPGDVSSAKNMNFTYLNDLKLGDGSNQIRWCDGPKDGVLKLNLEIDLKTAKSINNISYTPFGLVSDSNLPVLVKSVSVSADGTEWQRVGEENVWIGTNTSIQTLRTANNLSIGTHTWYFAPVQVKLVRLEIEQPNSYNADIGHLYYKIKDKTQVVEKRVPDTRDPNNTSGLLTSSESVTIQGDRIEGPNPKASKPNEYYSNSRVDFGNFIQKREFFKGKRWAIGIKDIGINEVRYSQIGTYISKPFKVSGVIDRVALEANYYIPESFDPNERWIKFYVSPNDGLSWYEISPVQNNYQGIPEIVVFNDPTPQAFRDQNTGYYQSNNAVDSLRVKIVLSRPSNNFSASPMVNNYRLKVRMA